jgi:CopG family transcriptional regulator, nickel-responsive regulator
MQRVTVSLEEELADEFDELVHARGYQNRSEAVRDLMRQALEARRLEKGESRLCVASLSYIFNHHERDLAEKLTEAQHAHHDLVLSTMHVHLDHETCLESVMLKGPTPDVRAFADQVRAERGVRYGNLNLVSVESGRTHKDHAPHSHKGHTHLSPRRG